MQFRLFLKTYNLFITLEKNPQYCFFLYCFVLFFYVSDLALNIQYIFFCPAQSKLTPPAMYKELSVALMVNNSPVSFLAGILDFSLNSACLALRSGI